MQKEIRESAELLAEMIKDDPDYRKFLEMSAELDHDPELSERVHAFRKKNYELQTSSADPENEMWDMSREYQELLRNPVVCAYFEAEAGVCRMVKDVMNIIMSEVRLPKL